ncbi:DUF1294 domain-containing protein [Akkermansiaceae bacterium]|nr:DUF1294 domain-containing protein [Akkermansiaceae bacterium]
MQKITAAQAILLFLLLIIPSVSLLHFTLSEVTSPKIRLMIAAWLMLSSLLAYIQISSDKKKAQADQWRTPETQLHLIELLGGWPGSFIAQRRFRHKTSKNSYQSTFWFIVIAYQFLAIDYLRNWSISLYLIAKLSEAFAA